MSKAVFDLKLRMVLRASVLGALALFSAGVAHADQNADGGGLATRFVQMSDAPLRAAARRAMERAVSGRISGVDSAEREAMAAEVVAVLEPIIERRWPQLKTALGDAPAADFTAAELQELIDLQSLLARPDVTRAMTASAAATTDGARLHAFATLPREDMNRVIMALGSPLARRVDATLRSVAEGVGGEVVDIVPAIGKTPFDAFNVAQLGRADHYSFEATVDDGWGTRHDRPGFSD